MVIPHETNEGDWTKYGFHEDGFSSGVKVAMDHLGATIPFQFVDSTFSRGRRPQLGPADYAMRVFVWWIQALLWVIGGFVAALPSPTTIAMKEKKER